MWGSGEGGGVWCGRNWRDPRCSRMESILRESSVWALAKVPQGYSSNIESLVQLKDLKLLDLKSYDCHVLMQQLLSMTIRDICLTKSGLP